MNSSRNRAPIALFVYNRAELTHRTLEALAANHGALESDLTIFSDGPRDENDRMQVAQVRSVLTDVPGFRTVKLVEAPANRGLAASIIAGVTALVEEHGRVIVMEDDLITSPAFLDFINDALEMYRDEPLVGAISGYTFPLDAQLPETFFLREESCWGWATWKRAWVKFEPDGRKLLSELERTGRVHEFDLDASFPFTQMLRDQIAGKNNSWAIRWRASLFLNRMLSLYPGGSLVRNIGTDGSGTHARSSDTVYDTDIRLEPVQVRPIAITADAGIGRELKHYFRKNFAYGLWPRALRRIRRLLNQT
jgi:hypothetical protein